MSMFGTRSARDSTPGAPVVELVESSPSNPGEDSMQDRHSLMRRGFTLMEVVVAVTVIAILGAVLTPAVLEHIKRSKVTAIIEDFRVIETAIMQYYADVGSLEPLDDIGPFSSSPTSPTVRHFLSGDGQNGWDGPYIARVKVASPFGGRYDIDVLSEDQATIDLGVRSELGINYDMLLEQLDETLDQDGNTAGGVLWGDTNGIHYGVNYYKN